MSRYLILHNDDESAPEQAGEWINDLCQQAGMSAAQTYQVTSCVVEAINNSTANGSEQNRTEIRLKSIRRSDCLVICIRDRGPSAEGQIASELPEADTIGGRGWFIISSWMDIARYKRCGQHNVVTMAKHIASSQDV